jgi:hypothetical protein
LCNDQVAGMPSRTHPITPPTSGQASDKPDSPPVPNYGMVQAHHNRDTASAVHAPTVDENGWNPSRIIRYARLKPSGVFFCLLLFANQYIRGAASGTRHFPLLPICILLLLPRPTPRSPASIW